MGGTFWMMEKDGDGSIGYFRRWKKVKMGYQGQLQKYLQIYLFFFPSLLLSGLKVSIESGRDCPLCREKSLLRSNAAEGSCDLKR